MQVIKRSSVSSSIEAPFLIIKEFDQFFMAAAEIPSSFRFQTNAAEDCPVQTVQVRLVHNNREMSETFRWGVEPDRT